MFFLKMNYLFHHRADGAVFIDQFDLIGAAQLVLQRSIEVLPRRKN
jgi:hypothetical protein